MNKAFFRFISTAVLLCLVLCSCGNENKKEIKRFLKNYNGMVGEMEKLGKSGNVYEFEKYVDMFLSSSQRGNRLSRLAEWTVKDDDKFSDLFVKGRISIMLYSYIYVEGNDYVSPFYMSTHEVTQFEYQFVMDENPSENEGYDLPVESVNWYNAVKFCNKLSEARGYTPCYSGSGENTKCDFSADGYRLPTENEWEWAAKGGNKSKGYKYSGSDDIKEVAWCDGNSDKETHPIRQKKPNELGIYDMSGNVREWCWDLYSSKRPTNIKDYTGASPEDNWFRHNVLSCVGRGGSYFSWIEDCEVSHRINFEPYYSSKYIGFRVVRSANNRYLDEDGDGPSGGY